MNTNQLIKEVLAYPELHDLITHLGDFHEAVVDKRDSVSDYHKGDYEEWAGNLQYWDKQVGVIEKLIEITKGC